MPQETACSDREFESALLVECEQAVQEFRRDVEPLQRHLPQAAGEEHTLALGIGDQQVASVEFLRRAGLTPVAVSLRQPEAEPVTRGRKPFAGRRDVNLVPLEVASITRTERKGERVPWKPSTKTSLPKSAESSTNPSSARWFGTGYRVASPPLSLPRN